MKNKKRHICVFCKAKKYTKYLSVANKYGFGSSVRYMCRNALKCKARGANYKK